MSLKKIGIVGAGPCGTYLAYKLAEEGHEVHLFEKENYIGGCWASIYSKGLFTEHSPRVMFNSYYNTIEFFREIGIDFKQEFRKFKGDNKSFVKSMTYRDMYSIIKAYLSPLSSWEMMTMHDLCEYYKISDRCRQTIQDMCYLMDGARIEQMTVKEFLGTIDKTILYSGYEARTNSDQYLVPKLMEAFERTGVKLHLNHRLMRFQGKETHFEHEGMIAPFTFDHTIVCIPPPFFSKVLKYSDREYMDAWGAGFEKLCEESYYTGIGVQFHFKPETKAVRFKDKTVGDWHIINSYNKGSNCLSCVIVDPTLVSGFTGKSANECSKDQILNEVWRQLMQQRKDEGKSVVEYENKTVTPGLKRLGEKYTSEHGAFLFRGKYISNKPVGRSGDLNVSYVGPHNETSIPFTSYESAVQSAKIFLKQFKHYKTRVTIFKPISFKYFLLFLLVIFVVVYLVLKRSRI